jgi:beta-lactam-binding protein with PASTA domain
MPWRRRRVVEEQAPPVPPRRPLIWPWLLLLLLLVAGGIAAAYLLTRDSGPTTRVPDVVGMQVTDGVRELGQRGYTADVEARVSSGGRPGVVLSQAPAAGTKLDRGEPVTIVVARGPGRSQVPRVVGLSAARALVRLQAAGLKGRTVKAASRRPKDQVLEQSPAPGTELKNGSVVVLTISKGPRTSTVPSVAGITEASAKSTLEGLGYKVAVTRVQSSQPRGFVVSQKPAAGTRAAKGTVVTINVSQGPTATTTPTTPTRPPGKPIPDVVGLAQRVAVARLQSAGFRVDSYPTASTRPRGAVVTQRPAGGTRAGSTSLVRIGVSLGSGRRPLRTVPDVVGMTEAQAKQALVETGFTVRSIDRPAADSSEKDVVLDQRPAAGGSVSAGSQVLITVGRLPATT